MAKRRKAALITSTPEQRERLKHLWFYFGNYGPKATSGNHSFIQRILEMGLTSVRFITSGLPNQMFQRMNARRP